MESNLFTWDSILTMFHGIALAGGAIMMMAAALYTLRTTGEASVVSDRQARFFVWLMAGASILLWLTVLGGTYLVFPSYRAVPPEGVLDLAEYPKALLQSSTGTDWLHSFAMESKEHVPWIAAMLATAVAFVGKRYGTRVMTDAGLNRLASWMLSIAFALVLYIALLGVFVNKVAPLE